MRLCAVARRYAAIAINISTMAIIAYAEVSFFWLADLGVASPTGAVVSWVIFAMLVVYVVEVVVALTWSEFFWVLLVVGEAEFKPIIQRIECHDARNRYTASHNGRAY